MAENNIKIITGRTRSVKNELLSCSDDLFDEADWEYGFSKEIFERILDRFYGNDELSVCNLLLIRYICVVHKSDLSYTFGFKENNNKDFKDFMNSLFDYLDKTDSSSYETADERVKKIVELVYNDFYENLAVNWDKASAFRDELIRGIGKICDIKKSELHGDDSFIKEEGKKIDSKYYRERNKIVKHYDEVHDYYNSAISKEWIIQKLFCKNNEMFLEKDLYTFAFGLNMDIEDLFVFMQKGFGKDRFDLWRQEDFIYNFAFKYAAGSIISCYLRLELEYSAIISEKEAKNSVFTDDIYSEEDFFSNKKMMSSSINSELERIVGEYKNENYSLYLDFESDMPETIRTLLISYKRLTDNNTNVTRTRQTIAKDIYKGFDDTFRRKYAEIRDYYMNDLGYARGKVILRYDPKKGINIDKGVKFYYSDSESEDIYGSYEVVESIKIPPEKDVNIGKNEIILSVASVEDCDDLPVQKESEGLDINIYVPKKNAFFVEDAKKEKDKVKGKGKTELNNEYISTLKDVLIDIHNKSYFKVKKSKTTGNKVTGKIRMKLKDSEDLVIPEILKETRFYTYVKDNKSDTKKSRKVVFEVIKSDVEVNTCEVLIRGETVDDGKLSKKLINDCSIDKWKENKLFEIVSSTPISYERKYKNDETKKVVLSIENHLYLKNPVPGYIFDEKKYGNKLDCLLKGKQLSNQDFYNIENELKDISRNDILTLSFLNFVTKLDVLGNEYTTETRMKKFKNYVDDNLVKSGFGKLYYMNPYDTFLMSLASIEDGLEAYINIWNYYLGKDQLAN